MAQLPDPVLSAVRTTPKDAQVIAAIMKEMDITDFEPRVINQLLEFNNRYVSHIIEEAQTFANHAGRTKTIDARDVDLAIRLQQEKNFSVFPNKELTMQLAKERNSVVLSPIKSGLSLRLPPDRHNLTACNYRLKAASKKTKSGHAVSKSASASSASKGSPSTTNSNKVGQSTPLSVKPNPFLSSPVVTKSANSATKPVMTSAMKFPETSVSTTAIPNLPIMTPMVSESSPDHQIMIPTISSMSADLARPISMKRKSDEDDDYDMN